MAKVNAQNDTEAVAAHVAALPPQLAEMVNQIRSIILDADPQIAERIKWNSPSFYLTGELPESDAKTYPYDIAVCNLHRGYVLLVLPTGSKITENTEILEGKYADGRRMVTFKTVDDVAQKAAQLQAGIREWVRLSRP